MTEARKARLYRQESIAFRLNQLGAVGAGWDKARVEWLKMERRGIQAMAWRAVLESLGKLSGVVPMRVWFEGVNTLQGVADSL